MTGEAFASLVNMLKYTLNFGSGFSIVKVECPLSIICMTQVELWPALCHSSVHLTKKTAPIPRLI